VTTSTGITFVAPIAPPRRTGERPRIPPHGEEHVDDLAELIDPSVQIPPPTGDLHIRLVHEPAVSDDVAAWAGGLGQQGHEPLHHR
jgi:hypothetical protein